MPFAWVGAAGAALGGISSLMNATSGGGGYTNTPYQYIPTGSSSADQTWQSLLGQETSQTGGLSSIAPYLQQIFQQQQGLPYQQYQQAANQAGSMYPAIAGADIAAAGTLGGAANTALGAGGQVLNTAFDPQQQLYDRTIQRLQDQVRAANTASGVATTPYGAGLEGQAMGNFNIDWQNAQLGRQAQGIGAYGQANQLAGADISSMLQILGQAPQNLTQGGALPVQVGQQIGQMQTGAANQFSGGVGSALSPYAALQSQIIPYLYAGQGAGGNAFNMFAQQQANQQMQQQMGFQGLTQAANAFGGTNAGQGTSNWLGSLFGSSGGNNPDPYANVGGSGSVNTVPYQASGF